MLPALVEDVESLWLPVFIVQLLPVIELIMVGVVRLALMLVLSEGFVEEGLFSAHVAL